MGVFWAVVFVCIAILFIYSAYNDGIRNAEIKKATMNDIKMHLEGTGERLDHELAEINNGLSLIKGFYSGNDDKLIYDIELDVNSMNNIVADMMTMIATMKSENEKLVELSVLEDQSSMITQYETQVIAQRKAIKKVETSFGKLKEFQQRVHMLPVSNMMDKSEYGKINREYWDTVTGMERDTVVSYIASCEKVLDSMSVERVCEIDIDEVLKCVWFFATEKTFSASDFQKAERVFLRIYQHYHADIIIAELYAKKKVGGEDALRDQVRDLEKGNYDSLDLSLVASGLMWMNAYQSENTVLQYMLTTGKEMTAKTQERLYSLTNGGGKAPEGFDVMSSGNMLYFDVSAIAWKDDEYIGLFDNLAFQDKALTYSLAVRDENKDLFIAQGFNVPERKNILRKFESTFAEEYGSNVTAKEVNCVVLSGSGEEKMDGIIVSSDECKQMGIFIHIVRIGKKLIIKFYTLFMPRGSDLAAQKQQALSMYKKLSPSVTMWESSLKDTMLVAVEQLLNAGVTTETIEPDDASVLGKEASSAPVF